MKISEYLILYENFVEFLNGFDVKQMRFESVVSCIQLTIKFVCNVAATNQTVSLPIL